jgi:peptidoglycan-N-acetylglucosamine deacetylase
LSDRGARKYTVAMRTVALTFDDGPDPEWTPRILRALARAGVRATFFVMASRVVRHPDALAAIRLEGHDVELHCAAHVRHTEAEREAVEADTRAALAVLAEHDVRPRRWRTPWGVRAPWTADIAAAHGLELVGWTADTHDWRGDGADAMLAAVAPGLEPGGVVLMHDGLGPGARRDGCAETVRLVPRLVAHLRERGLEPGLLEAACTP